MFEETRPVNDDFADAQAVGPELPISLPGSNIFSTVETGEPHHASNDGTDFPPHDSVWYSWTPAASVEARIRVCDSNFGARLGVYTGSVVGSLTRVTTTVPLTSFPVLLAPVRRQSRDPLQDRRQRRRRRERGQFHARRPPVRAATERRFRRRAADRPRAADRGPGNQPRRRSRGTGARPLALRRRPGLPVGLVLMDARCEQAGPDQHLRDRIQQSARRLHRDAPRFAAPGRHRRRGVRTAGRQPARPHGERRHPLPDRRRRQLPQPGGPFHPARLRPASGPRPNRAFPRSRPGPAEPRFSLKGALKKCRKIKKKKPRQRCVHRARRKAKRLSS